jgi:Domain of unknown function (DUF932)
MDGLLAHRGSALVTRDALAQIPQPESTDTFKPIPHIQVVTSLIEALSYRHISVVGDEYAVSTDNMKFFGVLEIETQFEGCRFLLGVRNANDKSMRLALTVGFRVLVCDNLSFHGDFTPVLHKHTKNFNLEDSLAIGIDRMQRNFEPMKRQVEAWRGTTITDDFARLTIYRAFVEDQLDVPKHIAKYVHKNYFEPEHEEFAPRTKWSLQNAFTSGFKVLDAVPRFKATAELATFFNQN